MHVKISSKRLEYEFDIYNKYTVLQGDSGTGKTTLCDLINLHDRGIPGVQLQSEYDIYLCMGKLQDIRSHLAHAKGELVIIDEFDPIFHQHDTASILQNSDNYFLIITRDVSKLDYLPVSVENILEVRSSGKYHTLQPIYPLYNQRVFDTPDVIITEDSRSSYLFFKEFYPEIKCLSAGSKSQVARQMVRLRNKRILVVYDSAAFGSNIVGLVNTIQSLPKGSVQVLDWYSFEWYILSQRGFDIYINPRDLGCNVESIEQYATEYIESRCKYSKSKIHPCISKTTKCPSCKNMDCVLRHDALIPDLKFGNSVGVTNFFGGV